MTAKSRTQARKKPAAKRNVGSGSSTRIPLRITDTTLRDAHQSLWATRMRTRDIVDILDTIDAAGYYSLEVWGGATFDVCLRFLRENPWERLRLIKKHAKKTPLQMLLRGQNILGYRNYPDDLLDRFVALACQNGMDIFRVFDALNDNRNLAAAIASVNRHGGHAQGTLCYTISPVHTVEEYVRIAREQESMGVDSICIKDMAGILSPIAAEKLVAALTASVKVPIQLHCHATSGMAVATYVEGVRAGAGAIDCAISVMSGSSSQPAAETMMSIFEETPYHANLDRDALRAICKYFTKLAPQRMLKSQPINPIDPEILVHHIPGGMISNLRGQLEQQNALDRLDEVLAELPRTRADLGYPPLVTPSSQIIGVQSVMNVLGGERYGMVPQETRDYVKGLYGKSPAPIDPKIAKKILGQEKPITCRPADLLDPILPKLTLEIEDPTLIENEEDIISYGLFPEVAMGYFRWRALPTEERPPIPADLERKKEAAPSEPAPAAASQPAQPFLAPADYREIQQLLEKVNQLDFSEISIRRNDLALSLKADGLRLRSDAEAPPAQQETRPPDSAPAPEPAPAPETPSVDSGAFPGPTINAPLNGTFYVASGPGQPPLAKEGDIVEAGEPTCIVEAMKLFNQIKAPAKCRVVKHLVRHGDPVQKDQPLLGIETI